MFEKRRHLGKPLFSQKIGLGLTGLTLALSIAAMIGAPAFAQTQQPAAQPQTVAKSGQDAPVTDPDKIRVLNHWNSLYGAAPSTGAKAGENKKAKRPGGETEQKKAGQNETSKAPQ